jgi:hypothetical protein
MLFAAIILVLPAKLLKSKTHRASVSGGAGFGSLQDFVFLSSLVPSTPETVSKLLPPRRLHEFGVDRDAA